MFSENLQHAKKLIGYMISAFGQKEALKNRTTFGHPSVNL